MPKADSSHMNVRQVRQIENGNVPRIPSPIAMIIIDDAKVRPRLQANLF